MNKPDNASTFQAKGNKTTKSSIQREQSSVTSKKLPKSKEVEEILLESIIGHEYFGASHRGFFTFLLFLTIVDISAYQTFFQLVIYLLI
jgi:hypothetical protein